jgi:hypothetical protein
VLAQQHVFITCIAGAILIPPSSIEYRDAASTNDSTANSQEDNSSDEGSSRMERPHRMLIDEGSIEIIGMIDLLRLPSLKSCTPEFCG